MMSQSRHHLVLRKENSEIDTCVRKVCFLKTFFLCSEVLRPIFSEVKTGAWKDNFRTRENKREREREREGERKRERERERERDVRAFSPSAFSYPEGVKNFI